MTTINPPLSRITPRAVELFRAMQKLDARSDQWRGLHKELHRELKLRPWQYPAIISPDAPNLYPPNTAGGEWHPKAQKLFRDLEAAMAVKP